MKKYQASKNAYSKRRRDEHRVWAIELLGGICVECGTTERLEFDHKDPSTMEFRIGSYLTWRKEKLLPEIMKCQLLCKPCHIKKTNAELRHSRALIPVKHGVYSTYNNRGCRCDDCRRAWAAYCRERNRRVKMKK